MSKFILIIHLLFLFSNISSKKIINYQNNNIKVSQFAEDEDNCEEGSVYNSTTKECESCLQKGLFYFNGGCIPNCPNFYVWNETDNICRNCTEINENYYWENYRCVTECSKTSKKAKNDKVCFTCNEDSKKYYLYGECVEQCPNYTITYKLDEYCSFCLGDQVYHNNKCIDKCEEPYITVTEESHKFCKKCADGEYYVSGLCKNSCGFGSYSSKEDNSCHLCFCYDNKGYCNDTYKCKCIDNYGGDSCEYFQSNRNEYLKIYPFNNKILKTDINFFSFNFTKDIPYDKIKWEFYLDLKEVTSDPKYKKYFITGNNEKIFGINPNLFSEQNSKIYLHLILTDINKKEYDDVIKIFTQKLDIETAHRVNFIDPQFQDSGSSFIPMKTKIEITQNEYSNSDQYKYYYKFSFLDENNEEFSLTNYESKRSIETYYIPFAKEYLVQLRNDRGELSSSEVKNKNSDVYNKYNYTIFDSLDIRKILNDLNYNTIEKIFILMIRFNSKKENINDLNIVINFINENYKNFINQKGFYNLDSNNKNYKIINYSEANALFALMNSIIINQKEYLDYEKIALILKSLKICTDLLGKEIKLSQKDKISLLRTFEQIYIIYKEQSTNFEEKQKYDTMASFKYILNKINYYFSVKLYPGEGIKIIGNKIILINYHLGEYDQAISFSSDNFSSYAKISDIKTYSYEDYGLNNDVKTNNEESFLYINENVLKYIINQLNTTKNLALNLIIENNNNEKDSNEHYITSFQFFDLNDNNSIISNITLAEDLFYSLEFNYKKEKNKANLVSYYNKNKFSMTYNYSNVFCYPKNYKENPKYYCLTYFNYNKNIIQCKCNVIDEISISENEHMANYYKNLQFKCTKYTFTNDVAKKFLLSFLILLLIPGLIFLLYDIFKENKDINKKGFNLKEKRREYYNQIKICTNSKYSFPLFCAYKDFPFFSAINPGYYNSPKYFKHLLVMTGILLGFFLNLLPFYLFMPFEEKQILIDKRDIKVDEDNIHSLEIISKYLNIEFIFALISLIIVHIFIKSIYKFVKLDERDIKYWKNVKDILKDFVYFEIKKNRYLGKNFARIKNRLKALYNMCGQYLLNKNIMNHPERYKKLENYLMYIGKLNTNNLLKDNKNTNINYLEINSEEEKSLLYELPKEDNDDENQKIKIQYILPIIKINLNIKSPIDVNSIIPSSFGIEKNRKLEDILKLLKPNRTDNFKINKMPDNQYDISENTINHYKNIKNKYMSLNNYDFFEKKENNIINSNLSIYNNINITLFNTDNYINCNRNDLTDREMKEFKLLIIMTFVLGFIFILLLFLSVVVIKYLMDEFEYFMVKIWILCTMIILFIAYFCAYLIKMVIASILLFNYYHSRNKGGLKFMFKIFVNKSLIYLFKIRNYITKYRRDFINI